MTAINLKSKNKGKIAASVYTIIVVLLLFLKTCSPSPKENFDNEGVIMVNLGYTETGKSDNVPESIEEVIDEVPQEVVEEVEVVSEVIEESLTQDVEDVEVVAQEQPVKEVSKQTEVTETEELPEVVEPKEPVEEKPQLDQTALFPGSTNNPNQGEGTDNGDQGIEEGSIESNIYGNISGSGLGNSGKGWGLNGRNLGHKPTPVSEKQEYGKVTVKIYVAKNGKVIKAQFSSTGSTTTDKYLIDLSIKEAYKVTFTDVIKDSRAPDTQIGFVTFHYKAS